MKDIYSFYYNCILLLRDENHVEGANLEIKAICFLNLLNHRNIEIDDLDLSDRHNFEDVLNREIDKQRDGVITDVLKEMVNNRVFNHRKELKHVQDMISQLSNEEISDLFEFNYPGMEGNLRRTDKDIIELVHRLVDIKSYRSVLDLCSGEGIYLNECAKLNQDIALTGWEISRAASLTAKMRLILSNSNFTISTCDVLQTPIEQKYDLVFSDMPWGMRMSEDVINDQDMIVEYERKRKNLEWSFIYKAINAMDKEGKAIVLAPSSALLSTLDKNARVQVVEKGLLEAVYKMPAGTYPGTNNQYNMLVFSYGNNFVKIVDASECYVSKRSRNKQMDIDKVMNTIASNDKTKVKEITKEEIIKNDYNLEISRYLRVDNNIELINPKPIKEIGTVLSGFQYTSKTATELEPGEGNISVIKVANIDDGEVDYSDLISLKIDEERIEKYLLRNNDILITTKGTKINVAVVENIDERKIIPYNNLMIIRITSKEVLPQYLCSFLCSETGQSLLKSLQTGSIVINITKNSLMDMNVSILENEKQKEIVERFNLLNDEKHKLKSRLAIVEKNVLSVYEDCLPSKLKETETKD